MRLENERKIGELVLSLLSHYWTAEDDPAVRKLQANDWIDDLVEFPAEVVEEACRMWRHANNKRPTPHDIRALARAELEYRRPRVVEILLPNEARIAELHERQSIQKWQWRVAAAYRWMQDRGTLMPSGVPENDPIVHELVDYFERSENPPQEFLDRLPAPRWP